MNNQPGVLYAFFRRSVLMAATPMFRFRVRGREKVPSTGPAIVVAPHRSWLDPPCLGGACPRPLSFLILRSIYEKPWGHWFYRRMGTIPVDRDGSTALRSLREAIRRLHRGGVLGVFPEGRVVSDDAPATIHPGAAVLSVRTGAPVIPAMIRGTARAWPHGRSYPLPGAVEIEFGSPILPSSAPRAEAVREMVQRIEGRLSDPHWIAGKAP